MMASGRDIILVGPARSGTTLVCSLLNDAEVPGMVALDEPYSREEIAACGPDTFVPFVADRFAAFRRSLLEDGTAVSTTGAEGMQNHYAVAQADSALRSRVVNKGAITIDKPLAEDFTLASKHTIPFTGMLDALRERFATYAILRNPLAVLASWNSIDAPYRKGEIPAYAAPLCEGVEDALVGLDDPHERQVALLEWHFHRYAPLLTSGLFVRYEDVVTSGGSALKVIHAGAAILDKPLQSHNSNKLYSPEAIERLHGLLVRASGAITDYYSRAEIDALAERLRGTQ